MEVINRNEILNDSCLELYSDILLFIQFMEYLFIFLNIKFNFVGGKMCYKIVKKKKIEFENVDMIVYLVEGR